MQGIQPRNDLIKVACVCACASGLYAVQAQRNDGIQPLPFGQRLGLLQQASHGLTGLAKLLFGLTGTPIQRGHPASLRVGMRQIALPCVVVRLQRHQRLQHPHAVLRIGLRLCQVTPRHRQVGGADQRTRQTPSPGIGIGVVLDQHAQHRDLIAVAVLGRRQQALVLLCQAEP